MCKYSLEFPTIAAEYDRLIVKTKEVSNAKVYAVQTLAFSSDSYAEGILAENEAIMVHYPYSLFLVVMSETNEDPASFTVSYRFDNRDPATLTDEEKSASRIGSSLDKEIQIEDKPLYENPKFWILVVVLVIALLVTIAFCVCLILMKRKNERISSKIQMLTDMKKG